MKTILAETTPCPSAPARPFWRSASVWLAVILVAFLFINVMRVGLSPASFAEDFGLPLMAPEATGFVWVYAIRTLFMALFGLVLLLRRDRATLALYVLVAVVVPVGDAILVTLDGAPTAIILRHILIAAFVMTTGFILYRSSQPRA